ncbi:MAG: peptidase C39, partial [Candidatus Omnitrophica bacterium]|nr:peptidase C39 [Candidatus Omnitrophota bacterium]
MFKKVKPLREIKQENIVHQSLDYTCGPAGLSTLLNYYLDDPISEKEIIEALHKHVPREKAIERGGFTLLDLKNFAQAKGYDVTGYRMDVEFLRNVKQPVLVRINFKNYSHFVIVK